MDIIKGSNVKVTLKGIVTEVVQGGFWIKHPDSPNSSFIYTGHGVTVEDMPLESPESQSGRVYKLDESGAAVRA